MAFRTLFQRSLRRDWASWVAVGLVTVVVLALVAASIHTLRKKAAIDWIDDQGGRISFAPSWLSRQIPSKARGWLDKKLGGAEWSRPFDAVTNVDLRGTDVEGDDFAKLTRFNNLEDLALDDLSVAEARHLTGISDQLKRLTLSYSKIGDDGIEALARFSGLERLDLDHTKISGAGLKHLQSLPDLERLHLHNTNLTDGGLEHLQGLSRLQQLRLNQTNISDTCRWRHFQFAGGCSRRFLLPPIRDD